MAGYSGQGRSTAMLAHKQCLFHITFADEKACWIVVTCINTTLKTVNVILC